MTETSVQPNVSDIGVRPSSYIEWPNSRAETFTFLLGWGVLLHKLAKSDFVTSVPSLLTTVAAITLVFRPRSVLALSALFAGIIGQVVIGFDLFGNHWPFLGLLGIVWLAMVGRRWSAQRRWPVLASVGPSFLAVTRYAVMAMWAVVVLHKANSGFFALPESCAVRLYKQSRRLLVALPPIDQWWPESLPPSVFAVEAAIAIGLLWPRARTLAVPLAVAFHVLSGAAVPSFAGVAFALYVPFVRPDLLGAAFVWVADWHQRWPAIRWIADAALVAMGLLVVGNGYGNLTGAAALTEERVAGLAVLATGSLLLVIYGAGLKQVGFSAAPSSDRSEPRQPMSQLLATLIPAAIVLALGLSPYVGLRTENSLSMYSNLRTESNLWNHWFVPQQAQIADTQEGLITVVDGGEQVPSVLRGATKLDLTLDRVSFTEADLARRLRDHCERSTEPTSLTLDQDGILSSYDDVCDGQAVLEPDGLIWDRVLLYRVIPDVNTCQH